MQIIMLKCEQIYLTILTEKSRFVSQISEILTSISRIN